MYTKACACTKVSPYEALCCVCVQLPVVGVEVRVLPIAVSVATALYCCRSYFSVILLQGGVGKNGSTVAVSISLIYILGCQSTSI